MWAFAHPLAQFDLPADLLYNVERWADDVPIEEIALMSDADFGALVHQNERLGGFATRAARSLPTLEIYPTLQPLAHDLLRVRLEVRKAFEWSEKHHGTLEAFWVWIEDEDNLAVLQLARVLIRSHTNSVNLQFTIPVTSTPKSLTVRAVSDRWIGAESEQSIDLTDLVLPPPPMPHLPLLDLPLLSKHDAFSQRPDLAELYTRESPTFDPMQTQAFHSVFHTSSNLLLCAPATQTRTVLLDLAMWFVPFTPRAMTESASDEYFRCRRSFGIRPEGRTLLVSPRKALARQSADRLRGIFSRTASVTVELLSRAEDFERHKATGGPQILVTSPHALLRWLESETEGVRDLDLLVFDGLEALDAHYELAISRLRFLHPDVRVVGSSAALSDASSLADYLGVHENGIYSFSPATRTTSVEATLQAFSTPHSFALLRQMVKPCYDAARTASGSTIVFVPSRSQCRATAGDLVTQSASDLEDSFVAEDALDLVAANADSISDDDLAEALTHGIGVFHEGLPPNQQRIALELFAAGIIRVLVVSREACWTLPVRASLVVVMSAQYVTARTASDGPGDREVVDYAMPDLLRMQSLAEPSPAAPSASFLVLCQKDQVDLYQKFLQQGIVVESSLPTGGVLPQFILHDIAATRVRTRQHVVDALSWTYVARRLAVNPSYYVPDLGPPGALSAGLQLDELLSRLADFSLSELESRCAILPTGQTDILLSALGQFYHEANLSFDEVGRLQTLGLDDLMRATKPLGNGAVPDEEPSAEDLDVEAFYKRLPRAIRNDIGERAALSKDDWSRRVLLAAFRAGRIPRSSDRLQAQQVELLRRVVRSRV
jgi:antiviral helicase SLH1